MALSASFPSLQSPPGLWGHLGVLPLQSDALGVAWGWGLGVTVGRVAGEGESRVFGRTLGVGSQWVTSVTSPPCSLGTEVLQR